MENEAATRGEGNSGPPWTFLDIGSSESSLPEAESLNTRTSTVPAREGTVDTSFLRRGVAHSGGSFDASPDPPTIVSRLSQQRRTVSANNVHALSTTEPMAITTFDPPHRSIFTSGPPTASLSSNTAQASISAASSSGTSRPLAALSGATVNKRTHARSPDLPSGFTSATLPTRLSLSVPEKDIDDPSDNLMTSRLGMLEVDTSTTLSKLFAASGSPSPMPISRNVSQMRSFSGSSLVADSTSSLAGHLLHRGYIDGRHSDITIRAFGRSYRLHKLMLDRLPFFSSAFSGSWAESAASEMTLHPEDIDSNITKNAFELALKRVYGAQDRLGEQHEALGLFATACWLEMHELIESSVETLLRQMHPSRLDVLIKLVTSNCYGKAGDRILASAKAMLCREGWEMPYKYWDRLPAEIVREIIGGNPFFVPGEWERWYLAVKLLNRRLKQKAIQMGLVSPDGQYLYDKPLFLKFCAIRRDGRYRNDGLFEHTYQLTEKDDPWIALYTSPEISPILVLLDEGIHYVHLRFEQLQRMKAQKDILGVPVLPEKVVSDALWMSMELRQKVVNSRETELELGLSEIVEEEDEQVAREVHIPTEINNKGKRQETPSTEPGIDSADLGSGSWDGNGKPRKYWIPSSDVSYVMGGSRETSISPGLISSPDWASHASRLSTNMESPDMIWATEISESVDYPPTTLSTVSSQRSTRFSHYPPFRFSADFPNPRTLKEKKRVYSQTVWYAGSMWNLYCQRVNTPKSPQLGIYLHRAKDRDPSNDPLALFTPSNVDDRIGQLERQMLLRKAQRSGEAHPDVLASGDDSGTDEDTPNIADLEVWREAQPAKTTAPKSPHLASGSTSKADEMLISSDSEHDDVLDASKRRFGHNVQTLPAYVDARPTIRTYFKIYSPSKNGRMLSVYESAPDKFNFSQSWGWKSSQMVLDDGGSASGDMSTSGGGGVTGVRIRDGRLRYMVVIGNV